MKAKHGLTILVASLVLIGLFICLVMMLIAVFGGMNLTDGCFYRYNIANDGSVASSDKITNNAILKATANYTGLTTPTADGKVKIDLNPNHYGEWLNTNLRIASGQQIKANITGEISLCRAYLPKNNLQSSSNLDIANNKIPIPRLEGEGLEPLSLIFNAKTDEWRNITEIYYNDEIIISISPDRKPTLDSQGNILTNVTAVTQPDIFTKQIITADCSEGKTAYNPICGRYSIYSGTYVNGCSWNDKCYQTPTGGGKCISGINTVLIWKTPGGCSAGLGVWQPDYADAGCWQNVTAAAPEPYKYDGTFTSPWSNDINKLFINPNLQCSDSNHNLLDKDYITGDFQNQRYFWFSANNAAGLLYRYSSSEIPADIKFRGSVYNFAKIQDDQSPYSNPNYKILLNLNYKTLNKTYLQFRFHDQDGSFADNTGGYILNIKQTKCRRTNGESFNDSINDRGRIDYMIVPIDQNPNSSSSVYQINSLSTDGQGNANIQIPASINDGNLWMRINNAPQDYKDSFGQYKVQFSISTPVGQFGALILTPLFEHLKGTVKNASEQMFKNMVCYEGDVNGTGCSNFFNYIKAILILYIMLYGMMFLLGMVQINQTDLVIRVIKVAIVAGLMNQNTFAFFSQYVFDFATGFSDSIIANMSGYSLFSTGGTSTNSVANPFMFLDSLLSKIFFSKTFFAQLLALIAIGIPGVLYFVIIFVALVIVVITTLRAIAIYLMAFMAVALLIGIAPLFLTFMLFETTKHLFDNWIKFTFRYMLEPVVLLAGIIILTQLFTIYLDFAVGYSVCWKCVLPIRLPFISIPGFDQVFSEMPLFCINWFAPWGADYRTGIMGMNMQYLIALIIIAYCMYGYAELSGTMVAKLTNAAMLSATNMGMGMSSTFGQKALGKVGLDSHSRNQIKQEAGERSQQRQQTLARHNKAEKPSLRQTNKNQNEGKKDDN